MRDHKSKQHIHNGVTPVDRFREILEIVGCGGIADPGLGPAVAACSRISCQPFSLCILVVPKMLKARNYCRELWPGHPVPRAYAGFTTTPKPLVI